MKNICFYHIGDEYLRKNDRLDKLLKKIYSDFNKNYFKIICCLQLKNILKILKVTKESIDELKQREIELIKRNKSLISSIDKTETDANKSVDGILRRYEKYQVIKIEFSFKNFKNDLHFLIKRNF